MLEAAEAPVKKEHDLQIRETRKLVEENLLVMLKLFAGKKQMSLKRREDNDSPEYSNFRTPPPKQEIHFLIWLSLSIFQVLREWQGVFFSFRYSPWNFVNYSMHAANTETPNKSLITCSLKIFIQNV